MALTAFIVQKYDKQYWWLRMLTIMCVWGMAWYAETQLPSVHNEELQEISRIALIIFRVAAHTTMMFANLCPPVVGGVENE